MLRFLRRFFTPHPNVIGNTSFCPELQFLLDCFGMQAGHIYSLASVGMLMRSRC